MARRTSPSPVGVASFAFISFAQLRSVLCGAALVHRHHRASFLAAREEADRQQYCVGLANHETHYTAEVEVGTPGQKFSLVADTGSNALIVPSCLCNKDGYCNRQSRCFQGTNRSSTFALTTLPGGGVAEMTITFGSGRVEAVIATESVKVDGLKIHMDDGMLLMTAHALRFPGPFEGILGLGVPLPKPKAVEAVEAVPRRAGRSGSGKTADSIVKELMKRIFGGGGQASPDTYLGGVGLELPGGGDHVRGAPLHPFGGSPPSHPDGATAVHQPTGFLEQARIPRFSMCLNRGADGVMRLNTPFDEDDAFQTIGTLHWALDFRGVSIGAASAQVSICSRENMTQDQKTPCGAIPDTGTTNIMMPKEHLSLVLEGICDGWERCRDNHTALTRAAQTAKDDVIRIYGWDPFGIKTAQKAEVLALLLEDCASWLTESEGLDELPPLHLHMADKVGRSTTLALSARSYIMMSHLEETKPVYKEIKGIGKIPIGRNKTGVMKDVCLPSFGAMEYITKENGPVWILGMPLFHDFTVGFDMSSPNAVSFTPQSRTPCGSCGEKAGLVDSGSSRWPRRVNGPARLPSIDTTQPL